MEVQIRTDPVDRVKNMVRHALVASPGVSNRELFDRAQEIAPAAVDGLSLRQFHAKFRLPITRHEMGNRRRAERANGTAPRSGSSTSGSTARTSADAAPKNGPRPKVKRTRTRSVRAAATATNGQRLQIRAAIVDFAVALESAEQRRDLVRVVATIDELVDRIVMLTHGSVATSSAPESTNTNGSAASNNGAPPS